jgi:hypothetical protein
MYFIVISTLFLLFYGEVAIQKVILWHEWVQFYLKLFLALFLLTIQLVSINSIISQILEIPQLQVNYRVRRETNFVFVFFAIRSLVDASLELAMISYNKDPLGNVSSLLSVKILNLVWVGTVILTVFSYFFYILIL